MAVRKDFTASDNVFIGETKVFQFEIFGSDGVTPEDVSTYSLGFSVRTRDGRQVLWKTTAVDPGGIVVSGVYDADPAANTQVVTATAKIPPVLPDTYDYQLWRLDVGSETVLTDGTVLFQPSRL